MAHLGHQVLPMSPWRYCRLIIETTVNEGVKLTSLSGYKGMYQLVLILSEPLIKTPVKEGEFPKTQ